MGKIIWLSVTLVLVWNQPIVRFARDAYPRLRTPQPIHSPTVQQAEPLDRYYRFIVIEHQRSWLGKWTTLLLPNERPDWSDEFLQKVPSIQHFCLPPCTIKKDGLDQSVKSSWVWTSHEWHVDFNRNVDKNGWEYGSWDWKTWASKSGLRIFTRRRYWIRHARLEQQKSTAVLIQPKRSLAEDSQSYDSSSLSSLDSIVSTPPSLISHLSKKSSPCHFLETPYASAW
ncbi:integral peroxisomal membrane peroxin-domain-containing protein [Sporodiniella umbellata]|nr:integral peroxisomal membrane peroxin-domain-containing protein [Sporodiniella umbellata]